MPFQNQPNRELTDVLYISLLFLTLRQIHLAFLPMTDTQEDDRKAVVSHLFNNYFVSCDLPV